MTSSDLSLNAALCLCSWDENISGQAMDDVECKVLFSALVRWLWSTRQDFQGDIDHLVKKARPQETRVDTFYRSFGRLLVDLIILPQHHPRSVINILFVIHTALCSQIGSGIFMVSDAVHSMLEHLLFATKQPNQELFQHAHFIIKQLNDIHGCIDSWGHRWEQSGETIVWSEGDHRERKKRALNMVQQAWKNIFGIYFSKNLL